MQNFKRFSDFWPYYVREHSHPVSRRLHVLGTLLGITLVASAIYSSHWILAVAGVASGYAFAWIGHIFMEKNRPATFRHPFYSFAGDFVLLYKTLMLQMDVELIRSSNIQSAQSDFRQISLKID